MDRSYKLQKGYWWIFLAYAFTFSWNLTFSSVLLAAMIGLWLMGFREKGQNNMLSFLKDRRAWILLAPFLVSLLGLTYSSDVEHGLFILGVAFCMFAQPIIFSSSNWDWITKRHVGLVLLSFVIGILTSAVYCLSLSLINYLNGSDLGSNEFFYIHLMKVPLSPGAYGNYMNISMIITMLFIFNEFPWFGSRKKLHILIASLILMFFIFFLFLLQAKGSIIAFLLAVGILILFKLSKWYSRKVSLIFFVISILSIILFIQYSGQSLLGKRFEEIPQVLNNISKTSETSTSLRLSAIHGSIDIIEKHPLIGVGTGAVKNELTKFYIREGYIGASKHKTDCHNQFLRSFAKNGIFGFVAVLMAIFFPIILGIRKSDLLLILTGATQLLMALTGDILDNQPGVVFHSFVMCFLIFVVLKFNDVKGPEPIQAV